MDTDAFVRTLDREGGLLASAAEAAGVDAEVPPCPGWQVRDLLRHTGMVHRWATGFVAEGYTEYHPDGGLPDLDGAELLAWFRAGHRSLVDTLSAAPPDVECWHFLAGAVTARVLGAAPGARDDRAPDGRRGGARRVVGGTAPDFAADGIDELLRGFHGRRKSRVRSEEPRVLRVRATDADGAVWTVRLSQEPPAAERNGTGRADCELAGPAGQLYRALWNRGRSPA